MRPCTRRRTVVTFLTIDVPFLAVNASVEPGAPSDLEHAAGALDRVERDALPRLDVRPDRHLRRGEIARFERVDDCAMLPCEVLPTLEPPTADHLHPQVDGQLPVDVREHLVRSEIDLEL